MKWNITLAVASLFCVGSPHHAAASLLDGLVGYYTFETDFSNDPAASGPDGTSVNGATAGFPGGIVGNAMVLNTADEEGANLNQHMNTQIGYGGSIIAPNPNNLLGESFSISAWYKINDPPTPNATNRYFVFEGEQTFDVSYGIRNSNVGEPGINDGQTFTESGSPNSLVFADAAAGGWRHVLQTYASDGTTTTLTTYIDGVSMGVLSPPTAGVIDTGINFGAARNSASTRGFDGLIDEVALWSRALSSGEVGVVFRAGLNGTPLTAIPEPGSLLLACGTLLAMVAKRRQR
jgi:alkaline phosphatase D